MILQTEFSISPLYFTGICSCFNPQNLPLQRFTKEKGGKFIAYRIWIVSHNFFVAKKDKLIDLYHPKFKRLHSLFLSNQDGKLSKKSSSLIKSTLIHNKFLDCLSNYPLQESCVENKFEYIGCRESRISNFTAGPWKKCDSLIRIH